ncbi:uncharacterized protein LOC134647312 isoform X1 [Cydia amplana]|uniref:uncharacterized protein LOC134647312 isoform X1 n=1 Tax=Cydia amplana TaxID=1869771 RepID=UPI002FE5DB7A
MGDLIEITTWPKHLNAFYKITSNALAFEVMANGNAAIGLSRKPANDCEFWIVMGERQQCWIKKHDNPRREAANTPGILSSEEYRKFWLTWANGYVRLGRDGYSDAIVTCANDINDIKYVTFSVVEQRNPVHWRFEIPPQAEKLNHRPITGCDLQWVAYEPEQELPAEPLVGGFEGERLYIARAKHRGSLTPGKFVFSAGKAYVSWGGQANEKQEFEVLCGFDGVWKPAVEDKIPVGAFVAGHSEDALERLYIGRVEHEGHLIPGKVQPSHRVCYFPYQGREVGSKKYEVLVVPTENERCVNKVFVTDRCWQPDMEDYDVADSDISNDTDEEPFEAPSSAWPWARGRFAHV